MSKLKNYTSSVSIGNSQAKIEKCLIAAGATDISKKIQDGICVALTFRIIHKTQQDTIGVPLFFKLPAKVEPCYKVLLDECVRTPTGEKKIKIREQAERTAWKIVSDWVEIQLAMIKLEQAELLQIFLPYSYDVMNDKTFFEHVKENGFKQLLLNQ